MISTAIRSMKARGLVDSRSEHTIEVEVVTEGKGFGRSIASLGAPESRDVWEPPAYPKGGVKVAIEKVRQIVAPKLVGMDSREQQRIDHVLREIDGTRNFADIGGNTATVISIAVAKAAASTLNLPLYEYLGTPFSSELPIPISNIIGGAPHARKGKVPDMQEHQVVPVGARSLEEIMLATIMARKEARELCIEEDVDFNGGADDEDAWIPNVTDRTALEILSHVCEKVRDATGVDTRIGIDVAAGALWDKNKEVYVYEREGAKRDSGEQLEYISDLIKTFSLYYVEDMVHSNDYSSYVELTKKHGDACLICGDDFFTCNFERLQKGIEIGAANSLIIKVNMTGTLSDTYRVIQLAREHRYIPVISRRSGETDDTTIVHLAVAWGCPLCKYGSPVAGTGAMKFNEALRIEEELGTKARMPNLTPSHKQ